jgi:hypothetical protein
VCVGVWVTGRVTSCLGIKEGGGFWGEMGARIDHSRRAFGDYKGQEEMRSWGRNTGDAPR